MFTTGGETVDVDVTVQVVDAHSKFISGHVTARDTYGAWLKCYYFISHLFSPDSHIPIASEETNRQKKTWQATLTDRSVLWRGHRSQQTHSGCLHSRLKSLKLLLQSRKVQSPPLNMVAQPWGGRTGVRAGETDDGPQGLPARGARNQVTPRPELHAVQSSILLPAVRAGRLSATVGHCQRQ